MSETFVLYGYWRSSAAYRVRIALNLKGLDYVQQPVHLVRNGGEQRQADYLNLNPQGLVPALQHGERILTQSLAICEYLEELFPQPALLPEVAVERAWVRSLSHIVAMEMHPLNNLRVLQYLEGELDVDGAAKVDWYRHWIALGFSAFEAQLAARDAGDFCFGRTPGLADICLLPQVYNAERFDCELAAYPRIQRIAAACRELPEFSRAAPESQPDAV